MKKWTYSKAGVNVKRVKKVHVKLADILAETFQFPGRRVGSPLLSIGHYAGLIDLGQGKALAVHVDGVGTKVMLAQMMNCFNTVGIDCVAMNVNDLICIGAQPFAFLDYIALERMNEDLVLELGRGLVEGARQASVAVIGGETAVMPDVITGVGGKGFDLTGMAIGIVEVKKVITGSGLKVGDRIVGVESSGIHSNGISLARKILLPKHGLDDETEGLSKGLGDELLTPTRIYVKPVLEILRKGDVQVSGLAHVTGGAFSKLMRVSREAGLGVRLSRMPEPPAIFLLIQKEGAVSKREMYRTFNMGVGFCVFTRRDDVEQVIKGFKRHNMMAWDVGEVVEKPGIRVGRTLVS